MTSRFDVATLAVVACLVLMLAWIAYIRIAKPRHDAWQPEELSCARGFAWLVPRGSLGVPFRLGPPFPSPTNGVRKVA